MLDENDIEAAVDEISLLLESYPGEVSTRKIMFYVRAMSGVTLQQIGDAVEIASHLPQAFAPSPGQLLELARAGGKGYGGMADHAWETFCKAVARYGGDSGVSFDDGLINATVRACGGWVQCCERTGDNFEVWLKKEFLKTYAAFCETGASDEQRRGHGGRLRRLNASYSETDLAKLENINTGATQRIGSGVPVLAGSTERKPLAALQDLRPELRLPKTVATA